MVFFNHEGLQTLAAVHAGTKKHSNPDLAVLAINAQAPFECVRFQRQRLVKECRLVAAENVLFLEVLEQLGKSRRQPLFFRRYVQ